MQSMNFIPRFGFIDYLEVHGAPRIELDDYQKTILKKASSLSNCVKEISIGAIEDENGETSLSRCSSISNCHCLAVSNHNQREGSMQNKDSYVIPFAAQKSSTRLWMPPQKKDDNVVSLIASESSSRLRMKLLCEIEQQRQKERQDKMKVRMQRLEEVERELFQEILLRQEMIEHENRARLLKEEEQILQQLHEEELQSTQRQEEMAIAHKQHAKRVFELSQKITEAEQRQKEAEEEERKRMLEKKAQMDKIQQFQADYRNKYQAFHDAVKNCKDKQALSVVVPGHAVKIKNLNEAMDQLVKQCKVGEVSNLDLQTASVILQQLDDVAKTIEEEVEKINECYDKALLETQLMAKQREEAEIEAQEQATEALSLKVDAELTAKLYPSDNENAAKNNSTSLNAFVDKEAAKTYVALQEFHDEFQKSYADLLKDDKMKKFRFDCQKAVNIPVNTISDVGPSHMEDKLFKLSSLMLGKAVDSSQGTVSASAHPQGIAFCKDLMAKKFVEQGQMAVSSKPEAAFAFAAVAVALWIDFPDFGMLLLSHFYKECPYLVPMFKPQLEGQSNQDYYKSLGYRYSENGEVEKQDKFLKRMSGIMRLYAAILISQPRRLQNRPHPHGMAQAWRWIACLLNTNPRPDICASLLYDFLEVTGNAMFTHYGIQFWKLLHLICKEYFPQIEKVTPSSSRGPVARLEIFLQTILKKQQIPPPVGELPSNFW